jgi:hypothetical protein
MDKLKLLAYPRKWFVLMKDSLYWENPNMIGFRERKEWEDIYEDELVVYYQFGEKRIKGIYEVVETRRGIDPNFGTLGGEFGRNELQYQCRLNPLLPLNIGFNTYHAEKLSFYRLINNKLRWDRWRSYELEDADLNYILSLL